MSPDPRPTVGLDPPPADAPDVTQKSGDRTARLGTLGGYRLVRRLGAGGMGEVWEAFDPALGRRVAVKTMLPRVAGQPGAKERFLREARSAAAVHHDHVVPIFHVGEDAGTPFLVMPLLDGETLDARLGRGPLPPAEVGRVGREAAAGLAAAHARGLVHRDVKPSNLWLEEPGDRVKLLDFGLARSADPADGLTGTGIGAGTPAYMAPEQADGHEPDPRADLFSLGAVLYRAATGTPAFAGPTVTAVLKAVALHHPPAPHAVNPAVPPGLSDLVMRLLAKDPADRPASAGAVAVELAALSGDTDPARPDATTVMSRPAHAAGRRWVVPVTVAAAVLVGVGVWLAAGRPDRPSGEATGGGEPGAPVTPASPVPVKYTGSVDLLIERVVESGRPPKLVRLDDPRALPLRKGDRFRVECRIDPPAYLYLMWVDPDGDITPFHPWDPEKEWGSRPTTESPVSRKLDLPSQPGMTYGVTEAKTGVATLVLLARPSPLAVSDDEVRGWFKGLPDLPLPAGGEGWAVWFDDYREVTEPGRRRAGFRRTESADPFARWQGALQQAVGPGFETAVSFARTGSN